jgi:competence protein ComEA
VPDIPFASDPSVPPSPVLPPRPPARGALFDRLDQLRRDPRVAVAVLRVFWFRSGVASGAPAAPAPPGAARDPRAASPAPSTATTTTTGAPLVVHVAGGVVKPGVVSVPGGTRVIDAIQAAGGARPNADLDRLNLAAKVADGERIAVPLKGQPAPALDASATETASGDPAVAAAPSPSNRVNLNDASEAQLEALPGIGPSLAAAIAQQREQLGGFKSVDDLKRVRGIGDARFEQLHDLVSV